MKKRILIWITLILIILLVVIKNKAGEIINEKGITKIGIVSVWSDLENHKYVRKEEVFINDKDRIHEITSLINSGKIDSGIKLDRLPAEYELNFYYDYEIVKCYYWFNLSKYNFNRIGISGEITINCDKMDQLISSITGEVDKRKLVNPY